MKKEWKAPEITCLNVKDTQDRYGGGTNDGDWVATDVGKVYGGSSGEQTIWDIYPPD